MEISHGEDLQVDEVGTGHVIEQEFEDRGRWG